MPFNSLSCQVILLEKKKHSPKHPSSQSSQLLSSFSCYQNNINKINDNKIPTNLSRLLPPSSQNLRSDEVWNLSWRHGNRQGWLGGTVWQAGAHARTWTTLATTLWLLSAGVWLCWLPHAGRCFCCWHVRTLPFPLPEPGDSGTGRHKPTDTDGSQPQVYVSQHEVSVKVVILKCANHVAN